MPISKNDIGKHAYCQSGAVGGGAGPETVRIAEVRGGSVRVVANRSGRNTANPQIDRRHRMVGYWVKGESLRLIGA